ncbi:hypothetical protein SCL_1588 [Sulfuricaulis limicola]|uniref:Uncharacterized protein n=1 Tax=Sulfuricaulis limicola TaxID=1620215 RepID=A0A1B4XGH4_9GAMM|nr:hypothetical protein [Sulfuricaulis limicola]BAV33893.1 hypothetical protein SCL_1588 [Sulfuricaulis limicola]
MFKHYLSGILSVVLFGMHLSAHAQPTSDQTLYLILRATGNAVTVQEAIVKPLRFRPTASHATDPYRYVLLSQDNKELFSSYFYDPLAINVDDFSDPQHPKGGKKILAEASFHLKVPYLPEATRIRFERKNEQTGKFQPMGTSPLNVFPRNQP